MSFLSAYRRRVVVANSLMLAALMIGASAQADGTLGAGNYGGARTGGASGYSGGNSGLSRGSSVITHGGTGFSIYSQRGVTRVIGQPGVSRKILLPDGSSARVIGDGTDGAYLFGARGNHRIIGNRPLSVDNGP